jgi:hypothetical protein
MSHILKQPILESMPILKSEPFRPKLVHFRKGLLPKENISQKSKPTNIKFYTTSMR